MVQKKKPSRGYWLPDGYENLAKYDGYYIKKEAIYKTKDDLFDWEKFIIEVASELIQKDHTLLPIADYRHIAGHSRFVLVRNTEVVIIVEEFEGPKGHKDERYVAVFVIIPEDCAILKDEKRVFNRYVSQLLSVLSNTYPGHVYKRVDSRKLKMAG